jgi:hypothetical protein
VKSIVGLLEYTVTGAFVWILFLVFLTMVAADTMPNHTVSEVWASWMRDFPSLPADTFQSREILKDVLSLTVGGAVLVAVFSTGYALDLLAPVAFSVIEIRWARKWLLSESRPWLDALIAARGGIVSAAYSELTPAKRGFNRPVEWKVAKYRRVAMFLNSYVLATAKGGQLGDLLDRLKVWRVSQSISLSMVLLVLAMAIWIGVTGNQTAWLVGFVVPVILAGLSYLSMEMTFFRLVIALESAAYIAWTQPEGDGAKAKPQVSAEPEELQPA